MERTNEGERTYLTERVGHPVLVKVWSEGADRGLVEVGHEISHADPELAVINVCVWNFTAGHSRPFLTPGEHA